MTTSSRLLLGKRLFSKMMRSRTLSPSIITDSGFKPSGICKPFPNGAIERTDHGDTPNTYCEVEDVYE